MLDDQPFDPIAVGRAIIRAAPAASLGTLDASGGPFVTLVTVATLFDGRPVLHLSDLAAHVKNLKRDPRASLLMVAAGGERGNPLAGVRITLSGRLKATDAPEAAERYAARHGGTQGFSDFHYYGFEPTAAHLVAGFGRINAIAPGELFLDVADCSDLLAGAAMIVDHMNSDHAEAVGLYATRLLGLPDADWRLTGCDPEGVDLMSTGDTARLIFPSIARTVAEAGGHLKAFAKSARMQL